MQSRSARRRSLQLGLAFLLTAAGVVTAIPVATQLDWDSVTWPNSSLSQTYTVGPGDVSITWTGNTNRIRGQWPQLSQTETGGLVPAEDALNMQVNFGPPGTQDVTATIDFTHPGGVTDVSFTVFDVDSGSLLFGFNPWVDEIQVTATDGTSTFNPSSVVRVDTNAVAFDGVNTVTGQQTVGSTSPNGNVTFTFNQPGLTSITFVYRSQPGALNNPGIQFIAIHDIDFSYDVPFADLTVTKSVDALSDPVSGGVDPKAIPGATMEYLIEVENDGDGPVDVDTVVITDAIPAGTALIVTDFDALNSGPVAYADGSPASTLTYTFASLGSTSDDIEFSDDGGATYSYTPADIGNGTDPRVTHIRVNPKGTMAASTGTPPGFELRFRVEVL